MITKVWKKASGHRIRCYRIPLPPCKRRVNKKYFYPVVPAYLYPSDEQYHIYRVCIAAGWDDEKAKEMAHSIYEKNSNQVDDYPELKR